MNKQLKESKMYAALIALSIGTLTRLVWAKAVMGKKLYRVPILWVGVTLGIALAVSPKTSVFILGLFLVDIISHVIKDDEQQETAYRKFLNWTLDKLPVKENVSNDKI